MTDWTKKRANSTKTVRYVTHYGHPDCDHRANARRSRVIDDALVISCTKCGMETRFNFSKAPGFPRQVT